MPAAAAAAHATEHASAFRAALDAAAALHAAQVEGGAPAAAASVTSAGGADRGSLDRGSLGAELRGSYNQRQLRALRRSSHRHDPHRRSGDPRHTRAPPSSAPATPSYAARTSPAEASSAAASAEAAREPADAPLRSSHERALQLLPTVRAAALMLPPLALPEGVESFGLLYAWRRTGLRLPTAVSSPPDHAPEASIAWLHSGTTWVNRATLNCLQGAPSLELLYRSRSAALSTPSSPALGWGSPFAPAAAAAAAHRLPVVRGLRVRYRNEASFRRLKVPNAILLPSVGGRSRPCEWHVLHLAHTLTRHREIVELGLEFDQPQLLEEVFAIRSSPPLLRSAILHARATARAAAGSDGVGSAPGTPKAWHGTPSLFTSGSLLLSQRCSAAAAAAAAAPGSPSLGAVPSAIPSAASTSAAPSAGFGWAAHVSDVASPVSTHATSPLGSAASAPPTSYDKFSPMASPRWRPAKPPPPAPEAPGHHPSDPSHPPSVISGYLGSANGSACSSPSSTPAALALLRAKHPRRPSPSPSPSPSSAAAASAAAASAAAMSAPPAALAAPLVTTTMGLSALASTAPPAMMPPSFAEVTEAAAKASAAAAASLPSGSLPPALSRAQRAELRRQRQQPAQEPQAEASDLLGKHDDAGPTTSGDDQGRAAIRQDAERRVQAKMGAETGVEIGAEMGADMGTAAEQAGLSAVPSVIPVLSAVSMPFSPSQSLLASMQPPPRMLSSLLSSSEEILLPASSSPSTERPCVAFPERHGWAVAESQPRAPLGPAEPSLAAAPANMGAAGSEGGASAVGSCAERFKRLMLAEASRMDEECRQEPGVAAYTPTEAPTQKQRQDESEEEERQELMLELRRLRAAVKEREQLAATS